MPAILQEVAVGVEMRKCEDVTVIDCTGPMTFGDGKPELRDTFLESLLSGEQQFVLNLSNVPYLDTSVLGEIVACWKRAAERGAMVKVVLVPDGRVNKLFRLTGFEKVFEILDDVEAAVASYGRAQG